MYHHIMYQNEIICYLVGNAITNANVRGQAPILKRGGPLVPRPPQLQHIMLEGNLI